MNLFDLRHLLENKRIAPLAAKAKKEERHVVFSFGRKLLKFGCFSLELKIYWTLLNRDYECGFKLWKQITENLPTKVVGDTPSLSAPAKNTEELVDFYNRSSIFLNTSIHSPIPTTLLEAMSCGCCVVTTSNEMISKVINNGENGFISNNKEELNKREGYHIQNNNCINKNVAGRTFKEYIELNKDKIYECYPQTKIK